MRNAGTTSAAVGGAASGVLVHPLTGSARNRVQAIAETLFYQGRGRGETAAELAHDARNTVQALTLYCDLLEEPGVLTIACRHYASELRLVAASCRRLVERLALLGKSETLGATRPVALSLSVPEQPVRDLREELHGVRNLLSALAGSQAAVTLDAPEGAWPVWLTAEDLTRVLVNLVKNSAEAMQRSGAQGMGGISITLRERAASADVPLSLLLAVEDSGPGIDPGQLEAVFEPGFTTNTYAGGAWPAAHRGLGLFICRSIVEAAGGKMRAANRAGGERRGGARIEIELPVRVE